ncbi:MAG: peptidoglycan DD-metalloendopeptidase family protein [Bacteroidetes bacterium]|nr:peptidoglycan DD-metalloendopeptidase family protein [Bacteroidota bacterium]
MQPSPVIQVLSRYSQNFHPVVSFAAGSDRLLPMDFTESNPGLTADIVGDTDRFAAWVQKQLQQSSSRYGIGGYAEHRTIYARSAHFDTEGEPRRLHLGTDIWAAAGTPVFAFMGGMVHSVAFNDNYGDYGATLILTHQLDAVRFHTLYGHISLADIEKLSPGDYVIRGQEIAHLGVPAENGHWPPHLHFQVIIDIGLYQGDYPGVCRYSERERYLENCPDPDLILQMNRYLL